MLLTKKNNDFEQIYWWCTMYLRVYYCHPSACSVHISLSVKRSIDANPIWVNCWSLKNKRRTKRVCLRFFLEVKETGRLWSLWVRVTVFNATFNNNSVILWQSVLLVEETRVPEENHRPVASPWQISYNVVSSTPCHERDSNSQH